MPWANGGGTSWEVAREPADGEFQWRVSLAEIDNNGPFSPLPGIDRVFTLASPDTIQLTINHQQRPVPFASPVAFSGEDEVSCSARGPALALNVMTRRGSASATVEIVSGFEPALERGTADTALLVLLDGSAELLGDADARPLSPLQAVAVGPGTQALAGECTAALIRLFQSR